MQFLETKHKRKSAIITTIILLLLLFVIFNYGMKYLDPPEEYGLAINFGNSSIGSGEPVQKTKKVATPKVVEKKEVVEEVKETPKEIIKEDIITDNTAKDVPVVEKVKEVVKKPVEKVVEKQKEVVKPVEKQVEKEIPKEKPKPKPKSKHKSFTYKKWRFESTNLTSLKDSLIRKKLIASDTDLKDFRKVFSGEAIEKPIVWTGKISELHYFISQLHNKLKLVENLKQKQWEVAINCFIQENGEPYVRTKLKNQKVPATSKHIDSALKTLK